MLSMPTRVQLPWHVVWRILKHVPYKQRMRMRLVCRAFAAEALAATDALVLQHTNTSTARTWLSDWIDRHGQLTSLRLEQQQYHWQLLSLQACPGLKSLQLGHIQVPLNVSANGSALQLLSPTTGLTRLALVNVAATDAFAPDNLMALTALNALKQLEVDASAQEVDAAYLPLLLHLPSPLIPCLTQVTHLALHNAVTDLRALQQVSCLTALQSLSIDASRTRAPANAAVLTQLTAQHVLRTVQPLHMLTSLCLAGKCLSRGADLQHLVQLRRLELRGFRAMDVGLLAPLANLQHLVLNKTWVNMPGGQGATAELLAWLARLDLTYLDLTDALWSNPPQAPVAAFSALTASSNLQHLDLSHCLLPQGKSIWQVVFTPHTRLPQLTCLKLHRAGPPLSAKSLHNMVRCCPALQQLDLSTLIDWYQWEVSAITGLSGLTSFTGGFYQQRVAVGVLSALTALKVLDLELPQGGLHRRPLLPLTQLRQLQSLVVTAFDAEQPKLVLRNKVPEGLPPDVWRQLQEWATASRVENCVAVAYAAAAWLCQWADTLADTLFPFTLASYICLCVFALHTGNVLLIVLFLAGSLVCCVPTFFRYDREYTE